ncbi:Organic cation transporter-like protein [Nymphon striatum]|nr:Organic cation transporter-like protein [Nymphon striatum]
METYLEEMVEKKTGWWQRLAIIGLGLVHLLIPGQNLAMPFYAPQVDHWCSKPSDLQNLSTNLWRNYSLPTDKSMKEKTTYSSCKVFDIDYHNVSVADYWNLVCDRSFLVSVTSSVYMAGMVVGLLFITQLSDKYGRKPVILGCLLSWLISGISLIFSPNFIVFTVIRFITAMVDINCMTIAFVIGQECLNEKSRVTWGNYVGSCSSIGGILLTLLSYYFRNWKIVEVITTVPVTVLLILYLIIPESTRWQISIGHYTNAIKSLKVCAKLNGYQLPNDEALQHEAEKIKNVKEGKEIKNYDKKKEATLLDLFKTPKIRMRTLVSYFLWYQAMIAKSHVLEPQRLPPTERAAHFHSLRVYLQLTQWTALSTDTLDLCLWGWKRGERGLEPVPTDNDVAPESILNFIRFTVSFCYFAFTLNIEDIAGNIFMNMIISYALEFVGVFISSILMLKIGRRLPTTFLMIFAGTTILLSIAIPTRLTWLKVGFSLTGRTSVSMVFTIMYLHTTEYMPTTARAIGLGSSSMFARLGSIASPYAHQIKEVTSETVVFVIYGVMCIICGIAVLKLPETRHHPLQQSIEDAENYDYKTKRENPWKGRENINDLVGTFKRVDSCK